MLLITAWGNAIIQEVGVLKDYSNCIVSAAFGINVF